MEDKQKEFREWLKKNHWLFDGHTPDEIAHLARMAGFDADVIFSILSHWNAAQRGANFAKIAEFHIMHETLCIEMLANPFRLDTRWEELADYEQGVSWLD